MIDKLLSSKGVKKFMALGMAATLLLLLFSLAYPAAKRAERIERVAGDALAATDSLSTAITYFAGGDLAAVKQEPKVDEAYRRLCGLLTRVKDNYGYERLYVVTKGVGGRYVYLLDAGYRDNATAGVDYSVPGTEYAGAVQGRVKGGVDATLSGKNAKTYMKQIITTDDHRQVVVSMVPLRDEGGQIIAALVVESPAGNTDFAKLGIVDFSLLALVSGGAFLILLLVALTLRSWRKSRTAKQADREAAELPQEQALIPPQTDPMEQPAPVPEYPEETAQPEEPAAYDPHLPDDEQ